MNNEQRSIHRRTERKKKIKNEGHNPHFFLFLALTLDQKLN